MVLADVFTGIVREEGLELLIADLSGVLDKRRHIVFFGRISLDKPRTLDDLGKELGVSRERVMQLTDLLHPTEN